MSASALMTRDMAVDSTSAGGVSGVAVSSMDTPIGTLHLAATAQGLLRMEFGTLSTRDDLMAELSGMRLGSTTGPGEPAWLEAPMSQLQEYFDGRRRDFDLKMDWRSSSGFYLRVQQATMEVGYGETVSYGELAHMAGSPGAARAVGTAMSSNPFPVIVPCHRVVRGDGSLGQYLGGIDVKIWLQSHEDANLASSS